MTKKITLLFGVVLVGYFLYINLAPDLKVYVLTLKTSADAKTVHIGDKVQISWESGDVPEGSNVFIDLISVSKTPSIREHIGVIHPPSGSYTWVVSSEMGPLNERVTITPGKYKISGALQIDDSPCNKFSLSSLFSGCSPVKRWRPVAETESDIFTITD